MTVEAKKVTVEAKKVTVVEKVPSPTTVTKTASTVTNHHQPSPTKKGTLPPVKLVTLVTVVTVVTVNPLLFQKNGKICYVSNSQYVNVNVN